MPRNTIEINSLKCMYCENKAYGRITYILYPMDDLGKWIEDAADKYCSTMVVITSMDWQNDLTPWPAKGVPKGTPYFEGKAPQFLEKLISVAQEIERRLLLPASIDRNLVGVSLSGLFTLWQWTQTSFFHNIACMSGSFWYEGFSDWFVKQNLSDKKGSAYFLLGKKEPFSSVAQFRTVGIDTQTVVDHLKAEGVSAEFDWVEGDHYQYPIQRINMSMDFIQHAPA